MLSAETATGDYPAETVETMQKVIGATEPDAPAPAMEVRKEGIKSVIPLVIADAVSRSNQWCETRLIFAFTTSGFTAEMISNLFPTQPVIALTPDPRVMRRLVLCRSVYPIRVRQPRSLNELFSSVEKTCKSYGLTRKGDQVIITGGAPFGVNLMTNMMMIHEI
jgi:pyruvate kinase